MNTTTSRSHAWRAAIAIALGALAPSCGTTASVSPPKGTVDGGSDPTANGRTGGPVGLEGVFNARHTGGLATAGGQRVRDNVLIRSGHLAGLDNTGCEQLRALQVRTVIDLRAASAVSATPDAPCVPAAATYYNADLPKILPPSEDSYLRTLDAAEPVLAQIYTHLAAEPALPAIIHCVIGRDRASLVMALVLLSLDVPEAQVLADFRDNQEAQTAPAWMNGVLARIDQAGGIEAYLATHGVTNGQLASLRGMALE